jgi:hypothetical protein
MKINFSLLVLSLLSVCQSASAAPPYSLEGLLPRAEAVFVGNIRAQDGKMVTLTLSEFLRGENKKEFTFELVDASQAMRLEPGSRYFVISQGDNRYGKPKPFVTVGQLLDGQAGYCGWIMFPIKIEDGKSYLKYIASYPGNRRITLEQAKESVRKTPYNADIYGKQVEASAEMTWPCPLVFAMD